MLFLILNLVGEVILKIASSVRFNAPFVKCEKGV